MGILGVCLMGVGIVFAGLVCIVGLCKILGFVVSRFSKQEKTVDDKPVLNAPVQEEIPNREEMVAALSAVIAEELGKEVSAIRIVSLKKI